MDQEKRSTHALERLFTRLRNDVNWLVVGGSMMSAAATLQGCATEESTEPQLELDQHSQKLLSSSEQDWAQKSGRRNRDMVQFVGPVIGPDGLKVERLLECGFRGGCQAAEILLHVRVRRQDNVDLSCKRVGLIYRREGPSTEPVTTYDSTYQGFSNGWEDWHVKVRLNNLWREGTMLNVNAWYQPGNVCLGNTFYDDNASDLYAVPALGAKPVWFMFPNSNDLVFTNTGITGKLKFRVANLDYDKQLEVHYTVDGTHWNIMRNGAEGQPNRLYYGETIGMFGNADWEQWEADIVLPPTTNGELRFAVGYTHAQNGTTSQTFWDNNAGNDYHLRAADFPPPAL